MNKKIVFMVVLIECFLAVLLIGVFGQAIFDAMSRKAVTEIYFADKAGAKYEDGINMEVTLSDSVRDVTVYWVVLPDDASEQKVKITCDKPEVAKINAGEDGIVEGKSVRITFIQDESVTITVTALDGSNQTDTIVIVPMRKIGGNVDI